MTSDEADQRIILSRAHLHRYVRMANALRWPLEDLPLFETEIALLEDLVDEHPSKIEKITRLVRGWATFREQMRAHLN